MRNVYITLAAKPEGKRPFVKPRRCWTKNIITYLKEIKWEVVEWFHLPQVRK
jgi:hypothetical protein